MGHVKMQLMAMAAIAIVCGMAAARDDVRTLVTFDSAEKCKGATFNTWAGEKKGAARWDAEAKGLHLSWTNSTGCFILGDALADAVRRTVADASGTLRHVRLRLAANFFDGSQLFLKSRTSAGYYDQPIGVDPNGKDAIALVRPEGFTRCKKRFEWHDLRSFFLYAGGGSGDYVLREISLVFDSTPPPKPQPEVGIDEFVLFPEPRVFRPGEGRWPLAEYAAPQGFGDGTGNAVRWFEKRVARFWRVDRSRGRPVVFAVGNTPEGMAAIERLKLVPDFGGIAPGGYALSVRQDGIAVVAPDEFGLMQGVRSLVETIHLASGDAGPATVREVMAVDWPRIENRMFYAVLTAGGQSDLGGFFERFVYPAGFNLVCIDPGAYFKYACDPGSGFKKGSWTLAEYSGLIDSMNAVGVKAVPFFMSPGHQWHHIMHGCRNMDLCENGDVESLCVRHPDVYRRVFAYMKETAGICSHNPRYKADFFYTGGDEVRWRDRDKNGNECPRCKGIPRNRLLLEHARTVDGWCRDNGWRMLMCSDMYAAGQNGYNRFLGARVANDLPRSIGMIHWSSLAWDDLPLWRKRGFSNWRVMTGYSDDPGAQDGLDGYGIAAYVDRWWLSYSRSGASGMYSPLAIAFAGADGWGEPPRVPNTLKGRAATWGNHIMRRWSRKPIPAAGNGFSAVDLKAAVNSKASTGHDFSQSNVGGVPCAFVVTKGGIAMVTADGSEHAVKVGRRASSLVFLHTSHLPWENDAEFRRISLKEEWIYGMPTAVWRVEYADGSRTSFTVNYGWNVGERDTRSEGHHSLYERFIGDARYSWTDTEGRTVWLHEWINPNPEKEIASITLGRKPYLVDYELWSLTARDVVTVCSD